MPSKKSTRVSKSVRAKSPLRLTANFVGKAVIVIAVCVMAGGIMVAARQQYRPAARTGVLNRIQMRKAIAIRHKEEPIVGSPAQADAAWVLQNRIDRRFAAGDGDDGGNILGIRRLKVRDHNRPRRVDSN